MNTSDGVIEQTKCAEMALKRGNLALACSCYENALAIDSEHALAYANLGLIHFQQGDLEKAEALLLVGIQKDQDLKEPYYNLGCLYQSKGEYEKALSFFKEVVEKDAEDYDTYYRMGLSCVALKRCSDAKAFLQTAFQLRPDFFDSGIALAQYFFYHHEYTMAESVLRLLLVTHKEFPQLYYLLGISLKEQGNTESALAQFSRTIALDDKHAMAYYFLGICCNELSLAKQAESFFRKAIAADAGLTDEITPYLASLAGTE